MKMFPLSWNDMEKYRTIIQTATVMMWAAGELLFQLAALCDSNVRQTYVRLQTSDMCCMIPSRRPR